jgi:hypothetical protein
MLKKILFVILLLSVISCDKKPEKDFSVLTKEFVASYSALFPDETPLTKENPHLSDLHIPTDSVINMVKNFHLSFSNEVSKYRENQLPPSVVNDFKKIKNILKSIENYANTHYKNPTLFNVYYGFNRIFKSNYASDEHRLQTLFNKLEKVPAFYEQAKMRLTEVDQRLGDEALEQHVQTYLFFDKTLPDFIIKRKVMTPQYQARLNNAKLAIKDYIAYVESFKVW